MKALLLILGLMLALGLGIFLLLSHGDDSSASPPEQTTNRSQRRQRPTSPAGNTSAASTDQATAGPDAASDTDPNPATDENAGDHPPEAEVADVVLLLQELEQAVEAGDARRQQLLLTQLASVDGLAIHPALVALFEQEARWQTKALLLGLKNAAHADRLQQLASEHPPERAAAEFANLRDDGYPVFLAALYVAVVGRGPADAAMGILETAFDGGFPDELTVSVFRALAKADHLPTAPLLESGTAWLRDSTSHDLRLTLLEAIVPRLELSETRALLDLAAGKEEESLVLRLAAQHLSAEDRKTLAGTILAKLREWKSDAPVNAFAALVWADREMALDYARQHTSSNVAPSPLSAEVMKLLAASSEAGDQTLVHQLALSSSASAAQAALARLASTPQAAADLFDSAHSEGVRAMAIGHLLATPERATWIDRALADGTSTRIQTSVAAQLRPNDSAERSRLLDLAASSDSVRVRESAIRVLVGQSDSRTLRDLENLAGRERQPTLRALLDTRIEELRKAHQ